MKQYSETAVERMMKVREVILRALAKRITWWQAAEILGISDRSMRRWRERYEKHGYDGLFDRRRGKPSPKRLAVEVVEEVLRLYQEKYFDFNVRHFHEKLQAWGRGERNFGTWQGRLPQELRVAGIRTVEEANRFLREHYIAEFNQRFAVVSQEPGTTFLPAPGRDLDRAFSIR